MNRFDSDIVELIRLENVIVGIDEHIVTLEPLLVILKGLDGKGCAGLFSPRR